MLDDELVRHVMKKALTGSQVKQHGIRTWIFEAVQEAYEQGKQDQKDYENEREYYREK